jgi:predicted ATP-binding protein involved in virulence
MRIDYVKISEFKNLKDFKIDLDENFMETVLLGQNATGKSNFIESLVLIFKYLDLEKPCDFDYTIKYFCRGFDIVVDFKENKYDFQVNNKKVSATEFNSRKNELLPKYVFTYYSGISNRLKEHFDVHQKRFYDKIIKPNVDHKEIDNLRRLFYVQTVHSYFVLLAYFSFDKHEKESIEFLKNVLGIEDLESILFILRKPDWKGKGDERFWGADGMVKNFLEKVWDLSIAPIYDEVIIPVNFRKTTKQKRLYLYISSKKKLKELSKIYDSNTEFFKALESTYISDLIEEVRVKIKKKNVKGEIKFKELSEGEQQLLTVIGLLKFTKDEESLILLDEPDTHLNPLWKWRYLQYLKDVVNTEKDDTQIIINTHDPLVIGSLVKEQVRIFSNIDGKITALAPDIDPKGLGIAGILTSELFGLPSILDEDTMKELEEKRMLQILFKENKLDEEQKARLIKLEDKLEKYGFSKYQRDPLYQKFIFAFMQHEELRKAPINDVEKGKQDKIMVDILDEILKEESK